ncbi:MAG: hypothetical protein A4E42_01458 [Methanoregulaceae archaeon PtaU1.Bin222]|nr:MAG: hypothetical protein A4E42_01458 [Methanoregulaceae archaeon PtaU1.Bin222]
MLFSAEWVPDPSPRDTNAMPAVLLVPFSRIVVKACSGVMLLMPRGSDSGPTMMNEFDAKERRFSP